MNFDNLRLTNLLTLDKEGIAKIALTMSKSKSEFKTNLSSWV